ncbi:NADPH-dependent 7-cyano-7-deazaguanine reductase QueF [Verminephrobacter aporrectodeae subsp. tuberculatae]|uniref:NADPH-dependent 7-cyano-7-deazaguanine reductase n=1 Tax=Verminephrobacter aporrectodeae subsp. tuberculatae TaxID=1110392 RepID=A0ABT3KVZ4_9BURK|nr:NADPH-dependent 7-cyano-7-deazaguanine reductase QueF [Verminephrobacter aporrectodeae]MCW5258353.1 NADPH-dependent 7-cyano-7-deazaguanine reductase QueF [Verminephrobacter aporrectodeae subsp. tuberculatae]MCW5322509.1 NADPH-dependent 7-cyano-7-deazaguanine reductase QueF [Verminephrobacter aporrectodeae subsp. tuberculatae]MCW8166768.1 NADPH-dependent 7-cyano-7-deazaguanine reductase QueF [Verminephrobacter aporrectodeae subsp. tuberculatae]MCW8170375.1 NADPH-dependent 7-cyano-7-deazaguani
MNPPEQSRLGKASTYVDQYDAALLFPIPRADKRAEIGITGAAPFFGADLWTAFELSWLNARGKPQLALAHITVPCETPNIVESKSVKLYLNSFNNTCLADAAQVQARIRADLGEAVWRGAERSAAVGVTLLGPERFDQEPVHELDGLSLDRLDVECTHYQPAPELLRARFDAAPVSEVLTSKLFRSNCPVTGQPDWASVQIAYSGPQIDQEGLLQYLVSFRRHSEFHEQCVERIFMDLWTRCQPGALTVYARYTRRGGIDINPLRTSRPQGLPRNVRTARQ